MLLLAAGVFSMFTATVSAADPAVDLSPAQAVRLIALKTNARPNVVEISFIIDGTAKAGDGFEAKHVRRVAAVQPVRDGSTERRQLVFHDLFWNESLGWFMWESRQERAGEAVYLWSELKGEIVNK